ncbi:MAG: patatin family protein [Lachnospiraceae bacterium]|jgi:predicted patatin/cPLA2 family phospholipase|nr:patatin family protein [Lachnospiraceae bacterium]MDE6919997.1 patatin family protein [Lachnospiraceae bacterium]MDE6991079.1 patatin family protein [Lachnospiraceae bacterium]MDE7000117.1 patatin family protein [Lachnospiraceae bacterium]
MVECGLVLEGGGMKGMYTAGVLEYFMEKELYFKNCYGVSAGACHLCNYISKQKKRSYHVGLDYLNDKDYCSARSLLTTGDLFNVDMCYDTIPNKLIPYDYRTAARYEGNAYAVVTNIRTGEAEYMPMREMHRDIIAVRASASLPLVSRNVEIGSGLYLDGGIADAIPVRRAVADGNARNVVILTKEVGYVRKQASRAMRNMIRLRYAKFPKVYELVSDRHARYNETLAFLAGEEQAGRAFVIRPQVPNDIGRIEKDRKKLEALYELGYHDAKKCHDRLMGFLQQ